MKIDLKERILEIPRVLNNWMLGNGKPSFYKMCVIHVKDMRLGLNLLRRPPWNSKTLKLFCQRHI